MESARWRYVEGKQKEAIGALESFARSAEGDYSAYAHAQLSVWYLAAGQTGPAQDHASAAIQGAKSPAVRGPAVVVRFLSQPRPDPSQWMISAEQVFGPGSSPLKTAAIGYGMLLSRQFGPASQFFETMYRQTAPALDGQARTLYAWTLVETSRKADAEPLVQTYPLTFGSGEALFSTLVFPRFFYVRGMVMEALGKQDEARKAFDLVQKFQADMPSIFPVRKPPGA